MRDWTPERIAQAAGAELGRVPTGIDHGPERAVIDSRESGPGTLFVGLIGEHDDGGRYAGRALAAGAWGVLSTPEHATAAIASADRGVVLVADDPLVALQRLATTWRRALDVAVIGITGSTGKTSTKDIANALISPHRRTVASHANFNTEIGLPLEILAAPPGTEVLVLEMGMRGAGQIAELATVAEPDVGVIVSVGPVHLELLGTVEAIAAAKGELIAGLPPGGTAIVPSCEKLLEPHLRDDVEVITFGDNGDVSLRSQAGAAVEIDDRGSTIALEVPFTEAHLRRNLLAAVAAARAIGVTPKGRVELQLSAGRGQRHEAPGGLTVIDDCYNANPMSMRAALDELAAIEPPSPTGRRIAVLGDMLELGPEERRYHAEIGEHAGEAGVELLVTVGPLAAAIAEAYEGGESHSVADAGEAASLLGELLQAGDVVLVKASRGVGLELVCEALMDGAQA